MVCCAFVTMACAFFVRAATGVSSWTNVAGNIIVGEVVSTDATSVTLVTGAVTQRVSRTVFPASELSRMGEQPGEANSPKAAQERVPVVIAPAWDEFTAKCAAKTATRGDLIAFKRFIAASTLDDATKKAWTQKARKAYQGMRVEKE